MSWKALLVSLVAGVGSSSVNGTRSSSHTDTLHTAATQTKVEPLDSWLQLEFPTAIRKILHNVCSSRSGATSAKSVASSAARSEDKPDYSYIWNRDSALTSLAKHKVVADSIRSVYANHWKVPAGVGVAVARCVEDVYMGGSPW
jgi:hypothetical protein